MLTSLFCFKNTKLCLEFCTFLWSYFWRNQLHKKLPFSINFLKYLVLWPAGKVLPSIVLPITYSTSHLIIRIRNHQYRLQVGRCCYTYSMYLCSRYFRLFLYCSHLRFAAASWSGHPWTKPGDPWAPSPSYSLGGLRDFRCRRRRFQRRRWAELWRRWRPAAWRGDAST